MTNRLYDNVYAFPGNEPRGTEAGDTAAGDRGVDPADASIGAEDLRAMAECLQYLYQETNRLDAKTTSRLLGAAAIALTQDIQEMES